MQKLINLEKKLTVQNVNKCVWLSPLRSGYTVISTVIVSNVSIAIDISIACVN